MKESITVSVKLVLRKVCSQTRTLKKKYTFFREKQLRKKFVLSLQTITLGIKQAFVLITIKTKEILRNFQYRGLTQVSYQEKTCVCSIFLAG